MSEDLIPSKVPIDFLLTTFIWNKTNGIYKTWHVSKTEVVCAVFHMHQTSGVCAGTCMCTRVHQMEKTAFLERKLV